MAVVKTDLVAAFGALYTPEGQDMERLKSALRLPSITADCAKPIIYDGEVYKFSNVIFQEIVQQFQKKFTEKGDLNFKPNKIQLRRLKLDLAIYPDDVTGSWLGFLGSLTEQERENWPIVKYILETQIVPQLKNDLESKAYFKGVFAEPVSGVAGGADKTMDGVKKLLDDGLADGSMNAVALSAVPTNANAFDTFEEFADNFDDTLSGVPMTIYASTAKVKAYLRDKRNTHGKDVNYEAGKITIDFADNVKIKGLPSMAGSPYIWATPDENYLYIRRVNGMSDPKVEEALRQVFLMLDWWEGIGFGYNPLVYVYKPA